MSPSGGVTMVLRSPVMRSILSRFRPPRPHRLTSGKTAIWTLNGILIAAGVTLFLVAARSAQPLVPAMRLPVWALLIGFGAAERFVVHVHFRRSAHSLSLGELPLVLGLIFASGQDLVVAGALGPTLVMMLHRKLPPIRLAFNIGQFCLGNCIAVLVFHAIAGSAASVGLAVWAAAALATASTSVMAALLIGAAVSLSEGGLGLRRLGATLGTDLAVAAINTSTALTAAALVFYDWRAGLLMIVPVAATFAVYGAYLSERQQHERLEFLYEAARTLSRSPEIGPALQGLLGQALEAFRAEVAEIILFSSEPRGAFRTTVRSAGPTQAFEDLDPVIAEELRSLIERVGPPASITSELPGRHLAEYLESRDLSDGMFAVLRGEGSWIGAMMLGNPSGVVQTFSSDDLKLFEALANNTSVALQYDRLGQAIWRMRELQRELQHRASHDPLTDLANRSLFAARVAEALEGAGEVSVIFIDIDDFKTVNDSLGHAAGDELLIAVAGRLSECVRPSDTVARLGGDEFAIMLERVSLPDEAPAVAERILRRLAEPFAIGRQNVAVRASAGIATGDRVGVGPEDLIRNADVAMYRAKQGGKHRYELFEPGMEAAVLRRHGLKQRLRDAAGNDSFAVHYQPIVALETGEVVAAEALLRWFDGPRGPVPPQAFIPMAEETGLIVPLGRSVLERACCEAQRWRRGAGGGPAVQVNLSPIEILDSGFLPGVAAALERSGLSPGRLVLEITESLLLQEPGNSIATLEELRELGVRLALDDFGTGYSSLSHLRSLPIDSLKIAKAFVDGLGDSGGDCSFVRMIVQLAESLRVDVVAEGIESGGQVASLRELGCGFGQGFYLGRPAAAEPPSHVLQRGARFAPALAAAY